MVRFDKTFFGAVVVDGKTHMDVLVVRDKIVDRETLVKGWFEEHKHSHHTVYEHELRRLLEEKPEVIIIGNGQSSVLKVPQSVVKEIRQRNIELIVLETPKAIEEYNELSKIKRVNALIHTTC